MWLVLCIGVMFGAMRAFSHEYRSAIMVRSLDADVIDKLQTIRPESLPVTVGGAGELMAQCTILLLNNPLLRMDTTLSGAVGSACAMAADAIIAGNPTFARAYAAKLVAQIHDFDADDYRRAMTSAPFEPWPLGTRLLAVERRVSLGGVLDLPLATAIGEDIDRAATSDWGRKMLAELYLRRPALQELIQSRVETRPDLEQAAFLRALRQLTNR